MVRGASVTPDYFRTMGISVLAGRAFDATDSPESEPVMIVNETFVRKLMREQSPLGTRVRLGPKWHRIVGVIRDTRYNGPTQPAGPEAYVPFTQDTYLQFVALRIAVSEDGVLGAVRQVIRRLDAELPITQVRTMRQSVDLATALPREMMALVAGFALVTLAMATLGLGGVMAYTVWRRKREIGLRMALGARAGDVSRAIIRGAAQLIATGSVIGVLCAFAAARGLAAVLYGVRPHDPVVLIAAPVLLAAIALLACLVPAHRAASVDPMAALRQE